MQTKRQSAVESLCSTAFAFFISVAVWQFIVNPLWNLQTGIIDNLAITTLFTVISVVRSYYTRRLFNHMHTTKTKNAYDSTYRDDRPRKIRQGHGGQ